MAENCVVPLLVITTIKAHTDNFRLELEQYLTTVAVNKGSLAAGAEVDALELSSSLVRAPLNRGTLARELWLFI